MDKTAVVLGVSGQIGTAMARRTLAEGWSVRGLHDRTRPLPDDLAGVLAALGDRDNDAVLAGIMADGADAVVDTIAYNSRHARQLLAHAAGIGALVVISSVDVYADEPGRSVNGQDHDRTSGTRHRARLVQNLRRAQYEIAAHEPAGRRLAVVFAELAKAI